jgi:hypothetical protein
MLTSAAFDSGAAKAGATRPENASFFSQTWDG